MFFAAVAFDVTPYIRGPIEWRWPYLYINTLNKILFPLFIIDIILLFFKFLDKREIRGISLTVVLIGIIILNFLWQVSVVNFSRAGDGVLIHRITDPGLNGYYSAGIAITNPVKFVLNFPSQVLNLPMHAKGHPPGVPLAFYYLNQLTSNRYSTALISRTLILILSGLTIVPLYYLTKNWRAVFLFMTIPSLCLFIPIPDVLFPFFGILSWFLLRYQKHFLAGFVMAVGLFFSYSILPVLVFLLFLKPKKTFYIPIIIYFLLFWQTFLVVIGGQAPRNYFTWLFFNLWDFIVFTGWPLIILFVLSLRAKGEAIFLLLTILLLNFSGFSRAETGRIWLPLMTLLVVPAVKYLEEKKFSTKFVMILIVLQMIQTLVIQEFWVPLW